MRYSSANKFRPMSDSLNACSIKLLLRLNSNLDMDLIPKKNFPKEYVASITNMKPRVVLMKKRMSIISLVYLKDCKLD